MYRAFTSIAFAALMTGSAFAAGPPARTYAKIARATALPQLEYLRDVRPVLAANCFTCHGQDDKKRLP